MAGLPGSIPGRMPAGEDETQRRLRDIERRLDEMGPSVAQSFKPQIDFLVGQSVAFSSIKDWDPMTDTSGSNSWQVLAFDPTYDDEYTFQSSSTGILKIEIFASVRTNNGSPTYAATSRGYSLTWPSGYFGWSDLHAANMGGIKCGSVRATVASSNIISVAANVTVTLRTCRAIWAPGAPDTSWHSTRATTVVVTRVGM